MDRNAKVIVINMFYFSLDIKNTEHFLFIKANITTWSNWHFSIYELDYDSSFVVHVRYILMLCNLNNFN